MFDANESIISGVVLLRSDGAMLLQRREDLPGLKHAGKWVAPGGHREPGESAEDCALREMFEETNYRCERVAHLESLVDDLDQKISLYWARYDGVQKLECREGIDLRFLSWEEALAYPIPEHFMKAWRKAMTLNTDAAKRFDVAEARRRCLRLRRRILEMSQTVPALHIGSAYSCMEIVDTIYNGFMRFDGGDRQLDTFLMSKGHGCLAQYMQLEERGILSKDDIAAYCKPGGRLGTHPDYGVPGIEASTGSLGHGMGLAAGIAYANKINKTGGRVYTVLSDGELQEGSTWEAMMLVPTLKITDLIAFVDLNDFQSLGRTSETHPNFYPVLDKTRAFGWESVEVPGHDAGAIYDAVLSRSGKAPFMVVAKTTKGKGVSYMESVPIWHYRSPNAEEFKKAMEELKEIRQ